MYRDEKIINYISAFEKSINKLINTKAPKDIIKHRQDNLNYYIEGLSDVLGKKKLTRCLIRLL